MSDGRKRIVELEGMIEFANALLGDISMTADQRQSLNTIVAQAKAHVKMQ